MYVHIYSYQNDQGQGTHCADAVETHGDRQDDIVTGHLARYLMACPTRVAIIPFVHLHTLLADLYYFIFLHLHTVDYFSPFAYSRFTLFYFSPDRTVIG